MNISRCPVLKLDNPLDREAFWTAHGECCRYCNKAVPFSEFEIDHIIPIHLWNMPDQLAELLHSLEIPNDYDLNSVDNLLLVHGRCNRDKGGKIRDASFIRHFRSIAADRVGKFATVRERLHKQRHRDADVAKVAKQVAHGEFTLQQIADVATQTKPFDSSDDIRTDQFIRLSAPCVCIECELPTEDRPSGSALITFHPISLRGAQIHVDHTALTGELFRGLGAPASPRWRPFLEKLSEEAATPLLRIGSVVIGLENQELNQFCQLLDCLASFYIEAFRKVEISFNSLQNSLVSPGVYDIAQIPMALWQRIGKFALIHDVANGDSEWHRFDGYHGSYLKVLSRQREPWHYVCFLEVVGQRATADFRARQTRQASLRWRADDNRRRIECCWSPQEASDFVFDKLLPKVKATKLPAGTPPRTKIVESDTYRPSPPQPLTTAHLDSPEKALHPIDQIQLRYLCDHDQFVNPSVVANAYQFLHFLIRTNQIPHHTDQYIRQKLYCYGDEIQSPPRETVANRLRLLADPDSKKSLPLCLGDIVDHAMRCILATLQSGNPDRAMLQGWRAATKAFEPVVTDYNQRTYLARMRGDDYVEI